MSEQVKQVDVEVEPHGSIWRFVPVSETAKGWVKENVAVEDWQWFGDGFVVDHRMAYGLVEGMRGHGLHVVAQA